MSLGEWPVVTKSLDAVMIFWGCSRTAVYSNKQLVAVSKFFRVQINLRLNVDSKPHCALPSRSSRLGTMCNSRKWVDGRSGTPMGTVASLSIRKCDAFCGAQASWCAISSVSLSSSSYTSAAFACTMWMTETSENGDDTPERSERVHSCACALQS